MHNALLSKSKRLQRVFNFLLDGKRHSTLEIINGANVCAVNSIISELRSNGININCTRENHVYYYQLAPIQLDSVHTILGIDMDGKRIKELSAHVTSI